MSKEFSKIHAGFVKRYGAKKGEEVYRAWLNKKKLDDTKSFSQKDGEKRELTCKVHGCEVREYKGDYYIEGIVSSSHVYDVPGDDFEFKEFIPKETLESFAEQINTSDRARIMGLHHSEGLNGEFFGKADVANHPARVIQLNDGEYGLYVVTKMNHEPGAEEVIKGYQDGGLHAFSITFDSTTNEESIDFAVVNDEIVKVLTPATMLHGYTAASNPINEAAIAVAHGYREFREAVALEQRGQFPFVECGEEPPSDDDGAPAETTPEATIVNDQQEAKTMTEEAEKKPCRDEHVSELREMLDKTAERIIAEVAKKTEVREKVLAQTEEQTVEVPFEVREFKEVLENANIDLREQFVRAGAVADKYDLWEKGTSRVESREYKRFGISKNKLEYRGLGITTNQNSDTDYLQAAAELADVYDPVIYRAINMKTVTWNILPKDNFSSKGNNKVQFKLLTAGNVTAAAYAGDAVVTANTTRLNFETKFKKYQAGISVSGDMIAAARGGPIGDVFAQEVMDSTAYLLSIMNVALFAEVGLETATGVIGFEYLADVVGNTSLYNLTRSTTNRLAPDSAGNTYINGASAAISMANLRAGIRNAEIEGADRNNLFYVTHPIQADFLRAKFDDARRFVAPTESKFGFSTDLFVDGVPIFVDKDCTSDNWHLVDTETHRIAIWVPPTVERLGKSADSEDAFIKTYWCTYNRCPRRVAMIYDCAIA